MGNSKVIIFVLTMTLTVALGLTLMQQVTEPIAETNEDIFNKRAVLSAIQDYLPSPAEELEDDSVLDLFDSEMKQVAINLDGEESDMVLAEDINLADEKKKPEADRLLPLYIYEGGDEPIYIFSVRGNGLWDEIWGYVAIESDLNTIAGAAFDHKGETPGLGAEIKDNPWFPEQFKGKKIYNEDGEYVSILVKKGGGTKGDFHKVDGLSGATITADGVTEMMYRGLKYYEPYLRKLKAQRGDATMGQLLPQ